MEIEIKEQLRSLKREEMVEKEVRQETRQGSCLYFCWQLFLRIRIYVQYGGRISVGSEFTDKPKRPNIREGQQKQVIFICLIKKTGENQGPLNLN